jgi:hypothetical protein
MGVNEPTIREHMTSACELVAEITDASVVAMLAWSKHGVEVIASYGTSITAIRGGISLNELRSDETPLTILSNFKKLQMPRSHPLRSFDPSEQHIALLWISNDKPGKGSAFVVLGAASGRLKSAQTKRVLQGLVSMVRQILNGDLAIGRAQKKSETQHGGFMERPGTAADRSHHELEAQKLSPLTDFLFKTLVLKRTIHSRRGVSFVTLRKWRSDVRQTQIAALQALKLHPPPELVDMAAGELKALVLEMYNKLPITHVVPIPSGSSEKTDCFSAQLAARLAAHLGLAFTNVLAPQGEPGRSSPRKSARLKPYALSGDVSGIVLLVDDVVSSGTHIELGAKALTQIGCTVLPIGWIGK